MSKVLSYLVIIIFLFQGRVWADTNYHLFALGKTHWRLIILPDKDGKVEYPLIDLYDNYNLKGKPVLSFTLKGVFNREGKKICHPSVFKKKSKALGKELGFTILKSTDPNVDTGFKGIFSRPKDIDIGYLHGTKYRVNDFCNVTPWGGEFVQPLGSCSEVVEIINRPIKCDIINTDIEKNVFDHYEILLSDYDGKIGKFETTKYGTLYAHLKPIAGLENVQIYPPDKKLFEKVAKENPNIKTKINELKKCIENFSDVKICEKVGLGKNDKMREIFSNYNKIKNIRSVVREVIACRLEVKKCFIESARASQVRLFPISKCGKLKYLEIDISGPQEQFNSLARKTYENEKKLCELKTVQNWKKRIVKIDKNLSPVLKKKVKNLLDLEKGRFHLKVDFGNSSPFRPPRSSDNKEKKYCFNFNDHNEIYKDFLFHTYPYCGHISTPLKDDTLNISICFEKVEEDYRINLSSSCIASPAFFIDYYENEKKYKEKYRTFINPSEEDYDI